MLEFISKHALIPVHRNINILGLRRLNITFLIVFYPSLQGFGWTGPVKLLVKFLTSSEIVAFWLVQSEQYHNADHCTFLFYSEKKKSLCKIFLTVKNHQGGINYGRMFFLLSTTHYFWTFSMRRALFLLFDVLLYEIWFEIEKLSDVRSFKNMRNSWEVHSWEHMGRPEWGLSEAGCNQLYADMYDMYYASQVALVVKNLSANAGDIRDVGLIPGSGRSHGEGHANPLQ